MIRKGKVIMQSEVREEIPYQMTTELQVFIWRSVPLYLLIIFQ